MVRVIDDAGDPSCASGLGAIVSSGELLLPDRLWGGSQPESWPHVLMTPLPPPRPLPGAGRSPAGDLWWGPRPCFRATHSMMLFRRGVSEVTFPSRPSSRPLGAFPPVFRVSKRGRFSRMPNRPSESRPLLRAGNGCGCLGVRSDNYGSSVLAPL